MSITISIADNEAYCRENNMGTEEDYECICLDCDQQPLRSCPHCRGKGTESVTVLPYELNIANGNFAALWASMKLEVDCCGRIDSRTLGERLWKLDIHRSVQQPSVIKIPDGPTIHDGGLSLDQIVRYVEVLLVMSNEAERREQPVVWG
jgi:hypothetical protein